MTGPENGVDRCACGCKYWEDGKCVDCGDSFVPTVPDVFLGLVHMGANHATKPGTYDPSDGFAAALCRSTLYVSVEHEGPHSTPMPAVRADLSCHRCQDALDKLLQAAS